MVPYSPRDSVAYRETLRERCRTFGRVLGLLICALGTITALGHVTGIVRLRDFGLEGEGVRVSGTVTMMVLGFAQWLTPRRGDDDASPRARRRRALHLWLLGSGVVVSVLGVALVMADLTAQVTLGGSAALALLAVTGMLQHVKSDRAGRVAVTLATIAGLGALIYVVGRMFGATPTIDIHGTWLPLPSALSIALAALGCVLLVPEHGLIGYATRSTAASTLLRVMLPATVVAPIVAGFIVLSAVKSGMALGLVLSILVSAMVLAFGILLAWSASRLTRVDEHRTAATHEVVKARDDLEARVAERTRELMLAESRLRAVIDGVNASIIMADGQRGVIDMNRTAVAWLGYPRDQLLGSSPLLVHDAEDVAHHARTFEDEIGRAPGHPLEPFVYRAELGEPRITECWYRRRDGSRFPVLLSVSRVTDDQGTHRGFVGIAVDMSAQRAAEAALVGAKEAAEASMRARADFLARMSHEIRTPLNGVLGLTALALETKLDAEQRDYVSGAREAAASLLGLIDDILDFSKIDAGKLAIESIPIELRNVLGAAVRGLAVKARAKGLALRLDVPDTVPDRLVGDPTRLTQVLVNLVGNAIKFTDNGEVTLGVEVSEVAGDSVVLRFRVSDTGIGIPLQKQGLIFEAFSQADEATTRKFGGTGLGLAISAQLVQMMGGRITVASTPGKGSTFTFVLPLPVRRPSTHPTPPTPAPKPLVAARALKVLVAEDNPVNLVLVTRLLERAGHSVIGVSDGMRAVEQARAGGFDAVLMDVQMPELDGLEATRAIRAGETNGTRLPIVGLTAQAMAGDDQKCIEAGMDAYLTKPFEAHVLLATLMRAVERG